MGEVIYMNEELKKLGFTPVNPVKSGVLAHIGGEGNVLTLMAHMDTLGAMVRVVKDNGALTVVNIGGLRPCNTETETVKVLTRDGKIYDGTLQAVNASAHVNPDLNTARNWNTNIEVVLDEPVKCAADTRALHNQLNVAFLLLYLHGVQLLIAGGTLKGTATIGKRAAQYQCLGKGKGLLVFLVCSHCRGAGRWRLRFLTDKVSATILIAIVPYGKGRKEEEQQEYAIDTLVPFLRLELWVTFLSL